MKRSFTLALLVGIIALVVLLFILVITQTSQILDSVHYRRLDRSISLFVKNFNNGDYKAAAYQFHYLEAQSLGGVINLAETLKRLATATGPISYKPHEISHSRLANGQVQYRASLTIKAANLLSNDSLSIDILAYEESTYGEPTIAIFDNNEFKDPL